MTATPGSLWIVGPGAVGLLLASRLAKNFSSTTLVQRTRPASPLFELQVEHAGTTSSQSFPIRTWNEIQKFPADATILMATKLRDLDEALRSIANRIPTGPDTPTLVLTQNGLGVAEMAADFAHVVRALCWFGVWRDPKDRQLIHYAGGDRVELSQAPVALTQAFQQNGFAVAEFTTPLEVEWRKTLWNVSMNGLCAITEVTNGVILDDPHLQPLFHQLLDEALAVAAADGLTVTPALRETVIESIRRTYGNFNSTLQDLRAGQPSEMPWLNDAVVKRAAQHRIPTPGHRWISQLIHFFEDGAKRKVEKPSR